MVTYKQHSRFYARNAGGKYALDVFELRQAFLGSGSLRERAREFRAERLGRISGGEVPVALTSTSSLVCVHVIPHASLAGAVDVDLLLAANQGNNLDPLYSDGRGWRFNLDGFVTYSSTAAGPSISYMQVFRNGAIETVSSELFSTDEGGRPSVGSLTLADELDAFIGRARGLMKTIAVEPPASIFVSLLGVRGAKLRLHSGMKFRLGIDATPFDRENLLFRDLLLDEWDGGDTRTILKPLLDEVWQAAGLTRCLNYDDQGNWKSNQ